MPSPFPGMDPFLEDPGLWPDVHNTLIGVIREFLVRRLSAKYYARIEERVYISDDDDPGRTVIIPDVRVGERPDDVRQGDSASAATLQIAKPLVIATLIDDEIHEPFVEVIDRADRSVVTVIEVVSPSNKVPGSRGRESYRKKRAEVLRSPCHWLEVDFLRSGSPWIPRQMTTQGDYFVYLCRIEHRPNSYLWPIRLSESLPVVAVPLKDGDADVPLDLQTALATADERAGYERVVDYRKPPGIPLPEQYDAWADQLLKSKGLR
jgi:hypothetical protein